MGATLRHPTFVDDRLEAELDERGFVVVDLLRPEQIELLTEIADRLYVDERQGFHASNLSHHHDYRHAVHGEVAPILAGAAGPLFVDHEPYTASLLMKWADPTSAFHTHQDWTMVDETAYRTVNVWCPLVDTTEHNGAMRVLPGSHKVLSAIRCSPMPPEGFESAGWQIGPDEMDAVEVEAGQAIVFDHALLHGSGANRDGRPRWAVATAFKPRAATLHHWYLPDPRRHTLEVFDVGPEFFADIDIGERPPGEPSRTEEFRAETLSRDELLQRCGRDVPPTRTGLMLDPELDHRLERDGWVVVDLFDPDQIGALTRAFDALPHEITVDRSFARGFHATVIDERPEYRRASHDAIVTIVREPAARILDRMELVFTNWVSKEPGAEAAPYHVDWTFVDEDQHRSVSIWAPLVDTDEGTGCMGVVDGSHRRVGFIRAAAHPTYQETDAFGRSLDGAHLVPLRAGQALVFDHRLVHFSTAHDGVSTRVAVTCEFVPREAELLHFEQVGPGRFRRHVVDPEFFTTYAAGTDPVEQPGHRSVEVVDGPGFVDDALRVPEGPVDAAPSDYLEPLEDDPLRGIDLWKLRVARFVPREVRRVIHPGRHR